MLSFLPLVAALAMGTPATRPAVHAASPADSASVHRAATGFLAAFDSLQFDAFRGYFADDITMFFPFVDAPSRADGKAAVEARFRPFFEGGRASLARSSRVVQGLAPRDLVVQMLGNDAAVVSFHLGSASPSRRSLVFRRAGGDNWKLAHWHASSAPAAPAPAGPIAPVAVPGVVGAARVIDFVGDRSGSEFPGLVQLGKDAAGAWVGAITVPSAGALKILSITVDGDRFRFEVEGARGPGTFELAGSGAELKGTYKYAGSTGALRGKPRG